jgi:hypothetical protein
MSEYLEALVAPYVEEINLTIENLNLNGFDVEPVTGRDVYEPLVERFMESAKKVPLAESLVQVDPDLAVELGLVSYRELLKEGVIPLNKSHVLKGYVAYSDLTKDNIKRLNFTQEEYRQLQEGR